MTKAAIMSEIATDTGLTKKQIGDVFDSMRNLIKRELSTTGPGEFVLPDMLKLKVRNVEAQFAKQFRNPATGAIIIRDVPASRKLRATPLKRLKELVL
jgi:nucleoid DNA-binding protein